MKCVVALAQIDPTLGDLRTNVGLHVETAARARKAGADIVIFPELSLSGYGLRDLAMEVAVDPHDDKLLKDLRTISRSITCIVGMVESGKDHGVYNAAVCFEAGTVSHIHRKVYLPTYGMFEEGRYFSAGSAVQAFNTRHGRIGMLVCEDMWHVPLPYLLAMDRAEVIASLTASPTRLGARSGDLANRTVNHEHHRSYARLLSAYVLFVNRVGTEDGVNFWGGSAAFSPSGETLCASPLFEEDLSLVPLDSKEVRKARRSSRHLLDERPEVTQTALLRIINERGRTRVR